ncbi:hypothetical protein PV325_003359, partial [Microctonus aethiopoides]
ESAQIFKVGNSLFMAGRELREILEPVGAEAILVGRKCPLGEMSLREFCSRGSSIFSSCRLLIFYVGYSTLHKVCENIWAKISGPYYPRDLDQSNIVSTEIG